MRHYYVFASIDLGYVNRSTLSKLKLAYNLVQAAEWAAFYDGPLGFDGSITLPLLQTLALKLES